MHRFRLGNDAVSGESLSDSRPGRLTGEAEVGPEKTWKTPRNGRHGLCLKAGNRSSINDYYNTPYRFCVRA
jgi:hypothetical protein